MFVGVILFLYCCRGELHSSAEWETVALSDLVRLQVVPAPARLNKRVPAHCDRTDHVVVSRDVHPVLVRSNRQRATQDEQRRNDAHARAGPH